MAEDWEKARDWLKRESVTKMSAKVPSLGEITRQHELYTYLKDGTELCRMIGLLTKQRVLDGIIYRPNNISSLEEKNVSLFINFVETEFKVKSIFGAHGPQVFHKFANFFVVLSGLAKLSSQIQKRFKIPKFESSGKKTEVGYEDTDYKSNMIQGYNEEDENRTNKIVKIVKEEGGMKGLDYAINEMIAFNERFMEEVLEPLKTFENKNTNHLLEREFFPGFKLDKVISLHEKLKCKFEKLPYAYTEIGNYFADVKDDFLVYGEISAKMTVSMGFFADQMSENDDVKQCVERMEREIKQSLANPDAFKGIKELAQSIMHYALKWPILVNEIQKRAGKEHNKKVEQEARKAYTVVSDVMKHVDLVTSDFSTARAMNELAEQIKKFPYEDLAQFGALKQELNGVEFAEGTHADSQDFKKVDLLIFEEYVLVVQLKAKKAYQAGYLGWVKEVELQEQERVFLKDYKVKEFDSIRNQARGKDMMVMWVTNFHMARPDQAKSFVLKLPRHVASDLDQDLRGYMDTIREPLQKGTKHEHHECQKYRAKGTLEESTVHCGECHQMMQGLFFSGVKCKTCEEIYHKGCFSLQKDTTLQSDEEDEETEDPEYFLLVKRENLELGDFYVAGVDEKQARELMRLRRPGVFLMTDGPSGKMLIVKEHGKDDLKRVDIKTVQIHGEDLFYIGRGRSANTILGLIQKVRRIHKLYCPINELDENYNFEDENTRQDTQSDSSDEEEEKPDDESHKAYFWGDISAAEAESLLKNQHPGTFLLRKNGDVFKLSWISFGKRNLHTHIKWEHKFFVLNNQRFRTLCQLVSYYQSHPHNFKNALGGPLINPEFDQNKTEEEKDLERDDSRKKDPTSSVQGFHGTVTAKDAEYMLQKEPDATYLVRKNPQGKYQISYRHKDRVYHLPIEKKHNKYAINFPDKEGGYVVATSLRRLVEGSKDKGLFVFPLHSNPVLQFGNSIEADTLRKWRSFVEKKKDGQNTDHYGTKQPEMLRVVEQFQRLATSKSEEDEQCASQDVNAGPGDEKENDPEEEKENEDQHFFNISRIEAKGLLSDKEKGTWILYFNKDREERLSFKNETKVTHMKIYRRDGGVAVHAAGDEVFPNLENLIFRLQQEKKLNNQLKPKDGIKDESDYEQEEEMFK